jgi:predicted flavoprotein YhiN
MYDVIIVGAGAAGLFSAANHPPNTKGLIIEKNSTPGVKLLLSGSGQCNFTNAMNIKDFVKHYGENGTKIRSALYKFNNLAVIKYFENKGVKTITREDNKVFPASLDAKSILKTMLNETNANGFEIQYNSKFESYNLKN